MNDNTLPAPLTVKQMLGHIIRAEEQLATTTGEAWDIANEDHFTAVYALNEYVKDALKISDQHMRLLTRVLSR